ncbi:MAG: aminotransferase class I/II-fold pyridoxal phosphate-dependent enzyme [Desulfobacterales bacterium]|jgi:aspartate/methionine/tyrosine aminotransferase|nr:aminotransferase class I/II-fold pyridoxal phosphate-dependent enzyme [Desulfobacterales bacterium]
MRLAPFRLERYFARHEFNVEHLLCSADCESLAVRELLALEPDAPDRFQQLRLGYTESQGSSGLRREICRLYQSIVPEQVLVHAGAEEAIFLFMHAALSPGDHLIVHTPCYQSLAEVARSIGCEVTPWAAQESRGWRLSLSDVEQAVRPNTRAIVVNTPHNPTGYLMRPEEFRELHRVADRHGVILFSDEVYRESEYDPAYRLPPACDLSDRAVSLGVMSKTYGLPGLRIGWVATRNTAVYERMAALKDYTTICNSAPSEFLAELALRHRALLIARNVSILTENLALLDDFFERHPATFRWHRPKAGPIGFPRLIGAEVEAFCHELVTTAGVLLLPGTVFNDSGNHVRIGFGRRNMPQALARLEEFLKNRG